jgi:hypothetical protein
VDDAPPAIRWLAEATESGETLPPLPPELAPATLPAGQAMAAQVLDLIGLVACGLRLAPGPQGGEVPGPLLESRLLRDGAVLAPAALPHGLARAGIAGLLAAPLEPGDDAPPVFASLHAALDIGASRFTQGPVDDACQAADLGGLGLVVLGRARLPPQQGGVVPVALRRVGARRVRAVPADVSAALRRAAAAARAVGGLPAGTLLLVAFSPGEAPEIGAELIADLGPIGRVRGSFA